MPFYTDTFLRRAERDDLDTVVAWMQEPDFQQFLYGDAARSPRQIREQIVTMLGRTSPNTMPMGIYLIIDSPEHGPLGMFSIQSLSWRNRSCTLDLYIGNVHMRNRMVTAIATFRALEYCFDEMNLHRVSAFIYAFNRPSWRIFEKSGAKRELTLKNHVIRDGQSHDVYGYGLLQSEFEALKAQYARASADVSLQAMVAQLAAAAAEEGGPG